MKYQAELRFFEQILKNFHLPYHYATYPFTSMPDLDLGLRKMLSPEMEFSELMTFEPAQIDSNKIHYIFDKFGCNYVFFQIPEREEPTYLFVGPYLLTPVSNLDLYKRAERFSLPASLLTQLEKYYHSLTLLPAHGILLNLITTLGETLWGGIDNFSLMEIQQNRPSDAEYAAIALKYQDTDSPQLSMKLIEERYKSEADFIRAVSQGQFLKAEKFIAPYSFSNLEARTAEPLRNDKNYTIVLNTLLRKAAELGSVHPFHIDNLSAKFARKIEMMTSTKEIEQLQREMVHKYCLLVKNHSMKGYSLLIRKVLTQIDTDLTADLSLKALADTLNVNSSYLSTLFKKETGSTLTEYVNRKRIEHALLLLNSTNLQVQTVAQHCGISDVNYFTKLFKKQIGKTPKEYRQTILTHK